MRTALVALSLVALAGCSSGESAAPEEPLPTVSSATTCGALFDGDAPAEGVVDLMSKPTTEPADADAARGYADDMESLGSQAGAELEPHVGVVVDELREFAETVDERTSYDTADMVTSLTELNNVCGVTPRF